MFDNKATLSYQYQDTTAIKALYDSLFALFSLASPIEINKFFSIDLVAGKWLDQLGGIYNISRWYSNFNDAFTLNIDRLDDTSVVLNGLPGMINDKKYRTLIYLSLYKNNKIFTLKNIYKVLTDAFSPATIDITEETMSITIDLVFSSGADLRIFNALYEIDNNILGKPNGIAVTINRSLA